MCSIQNTCPGATRVTLREFDNTVIQNVSDSVLCRGAQVLATQQVASPPDSLLLLDSPEAGVDAGQEGAGTGSIFLHIGAPMGRATTLS